jgi:hypothetical protein
MFIYIYIYTHIYVYNIRQLCELLAAFLSFCAAALFMYSLTAMFARTYIHAYIHTHSILFHILADNHFCIDNLHPSQICYGHSCIHVHMHSDIHTYMHTFIHTHTHIHMYIYIYVCIYMYIYIYTHTHTHTNIHTFVPINVYM